MGLKNFGNRCQEHGRAVFNVPAVDGDYAEERITFGGVASGVRQLSLVGVSALIEGVPPSGARVELWLPKAAVSEQHGSFDDDDYFYAGQALYPALADVTLTGETASYGSATWALSGVAGAQLRVKSAGSSGAMSVSGWCI